MYESFWQLNCKPFENDTESRFYFPSESHQGALLKLRYAIENRRSSALLCAASGLGKTMLTQVLLRQLPDLLTPQIQLVFPQMPAAQLLSYLSAELTGEPLDDTPRVDTSIQAMDAFLADNAGRGRHAVIVIDEAQVLDEMNTLETVRLLMNLRYNDQSPLTVLLVSQPTILPVLSRTPGFEERIAVRCLLDPLSAEQTGQYIHHRLREAGAGHEIFDKSALAAVHEQTGGIPRRINRLCDLALLIGFAEESDLISADDIGAVAEELVAVVSE